LFLLVNLLVGKLVRPRSPNKEKLDVYECGEPAIGSSFVQFDLRFYVVALLFIIFDVEVAFFFPWATVFGKATQLTSPQMEVLAVDQDAQAEPNLLSEAARQRYRELGVGEDTVTPLTPAVAKQRQWPTDAASLHRAAVRQNARKMAVTSLVDIGVFFAVLLVGFAYVWRRGDLDWVRSVSSQEGEVVERTLHSEQIRGPGASQRPAGSILSA
jgi:NADH-quinone oxidoreductase subunit A